MKKLVLFLAVAFSVSLFSCGGHDKQADAVDSVAVEEAAVVVEEPVCENDSCTAENCDSCTAEAPCEAAPEA